MLNPTGVSKLAFILLATDQATQPNPLLSLWPIILIFVIFYFLLIRPQQKRQKEHQKMVESLRKGDRVLTSGGIYGVVVGVKDNVVVLKIAENVKVEFAKSSVSHIVSRD